MTQPAPALPPSWADCWCWGSAAPTSTTWASCCTGAMPTATTAAPASSASTWPATSRAAGAVSTRAGLACPGIYRPTSRPVCSGAPGSTRGAPLPAKHAAKHVAAKHAAKQPSATGAQHPQQPEQQVGKPAPDSPSAKGKTPRAAKGNRVERALAALTSAATAHDGSSSQGAGSHPKYPSFARAHMRARESERETRARPLARSIVNRRIPRA